jgi:hypothetical protein
MKVLMNEKVVITEENQNTYIVDGDDEFYVNGKTIYQYPLKVEGIIEWEE